MAWLTIPRGGVRVTVHGAHVTIRDGDVSFELGDRRLIAGRTPPTSADGDVIAIEVRDATMSKRHFAIAKVETITREENMYALEDVNSTGGTFVNSERIITRKKHVLQEGDVIYLGLPGGAARLVYSNLAPDDSPRSAIGQMPPIKSES